MAWLGPGSCEDLASILRDQTVWPRSADSPVVSSVDSTGPIPVLRTGTDGAMVEPQLAAPVPVSAVTVGHLLSIAPVVFAHAQSCDICSERLRLLTPVRSLIGQLPLELVPSSVASAAHTARRRLPAPLPPSIERQRLDYKRLQVPAFGIIALVGVVLVGVFLYQSNDNDGQPSQAARVATLIQDAPTSRLLGTPTIITPATKTASLANTGTQPITWSVTTNETWIKLSPTSGRVQPSQSISITVTAEPPDTAPTDATITITGDDGSVQTLRYDANGG